MLNQSGSSHLGGRAFFMLGLLLLSGSQLIAQAQTGVADVSAAEVNTAKTSEREIRLNDALGREVVLSQPARRIISLAPSITENLYSAGLGERIVGAVEFSDYPQAATDIPRIGNYTSLNIEAILALNPDLIIAWQSGNPAASVERLIKLGLTVFYVESHNFTEVLQTVQQLATLGGTQVAIGHHLQRLAEEYKILLADNQTKTPMRVLYQVWNEPLITLNGGHFASHAIASCGGINVFADAPSTAPRINLEAVISKNPQVIILGGQPESRRNWQANWQKWPSIAAVANKQVVYINPDIVSRPSLRLLDGTRAICRLLDKARARR